MTTDIHELAQRLGATVTGQYLLVRVDRRFTQYEAPYKVLHLEDATGSIIAYVWERTGLLESVPVGTPVPVDVTLQSRQLNGTTVADVTAIRMLEAHEVRNAAKLLPFAECPREARPGAGGPRRICRWPGTDCPARLPEPRAARPRGCNDANKLQGQPRASPCGAGRPVDPQHGSPAYCGRHGSRPAKPGRAGHHAGGSSAARPR